MPSAPLNATATASKESPGCATVAWEKPGDAQAGATYEVIALPTMTVHTTDEGRPGVNKIELQICGLEPGAQYSFEVRTVEGGAKSDAAKTGTVKIEAASPSVWWAVSAWALFLVPVGVAIATAFVSWPDATREGVAFACGVLALGLLLLNLCGGAKSFGLWRGVIGKDGRVSTSKATTGLWTLLVAFALAYLTARTWFQGESGLFDGFMPGANATEKATPIWDDYLVVLGGPFAALVLARGIVSTKVQNQTVQKTTADDGTAQLKQLLSDDSGNVSLVDSQYLLFNIVALTYVIVGFASTGQLPAIPAILLALTGSSAATYVVNKALTNERPTITGVMPSSFRPGERVVITGNNLLPAGPSAPPVVSIGGKQALVDANATNAQIVVTAPPGVAPGLQQLIVTTAARAETEPRPVQVLADQPEVLGVEPSSPAVGEQMTLRGVGFASELDPTTTCAVKIGDGPPLDATPTRLPTGMEELSVVVPAGTSTAAPLPVVVSTPRGTSSEAVNVTFKA
jgi:hypothetical protein